MARTMWARRTGSIIAAAAVGAGLSTAPASAAVAGTVDVAAGNTLTVRSTPSTSGTIVARLADGAAISINCYVTGTTVTGTFGTTNKWDKLSNGYVSHAYVRTSVAVPACTTTTPTTTGKVDVAAGATLTVRSTPSTSGTIVARLADGASVTVQCYTTGTTVTGTFGTTSRWDKLSNGYISHAYVSGATGAPACATTPPPPPPTTTSKATAIVNAGLSMVGKYPYVSWAGNYYGPTTGTNLGSHPEDTYTKGFDCSGLMQYAFYKGAGYKIPERSSKDMYAGGQARGQLVPLAQRRAGDMGFSKGSNGVISHVWLFTSATSIVHAASHDTDITTRSNWTPSSNTMPYVLRPVR